MTTADQDDLLHRELRRLPLPAAPPTLLPRVMAAAETQASARWYQRAWLTWPWPAQLVSALAFAALVIVIVQALPGVQRTVADVVALRGSTRAIALLRTVREGAALMRVSWEILLQPVATYVAVLTMVVSLGCAALWTTLNRFALGGASHQ